LCGEVVIKLMMGGNIRDWKIVQLTGEGEGEGGEGGGRQE
jgi:hypothetical protein